ncbi:MAG: hypothetical protein AB1498_03400 [bacterium]
MLSGTEVDIVNCVARLKTATKEQIRREIDFSPAYIDFLCRYLIRKGYLIYSDKRYFLTKEGIKTLLEEEIPKIDKESIKNIICELSKNISEELKKTVEDIKFPVYTGDKKEEEINPGGKIKIKTDFDLHIEDESLGLESNISEIGARLEREKSNIDKSVELLKRMPKGEKK